MTGLNSRNIPKSPPSWSKDDRVEDGWDKYPLNLVGGNRLEKEGRGENGYKRRMGAREREVGKFRVKKV